MLLQARYTMTKQVVVPEDTDITVTIQKYEGAEGGLVFKTENGVLNFFGDEGEVASSSSNIFVRNEAEDDGKTGGETSGETTPPTTPVQVAASTAFSGPVYNMLVVNIKGWTWQRNPRHQLS